MTEEAASPHLFLLQLSDSALPIGGFSNSWGFETWVQAGVLKTRQDAREAILSLLSASIAPQDGVACGLSWQFYAANNQNAFVELNNYLTASRWTAETLNASLNMGRRLFQLAESAFNYPGGKLQPHLPIASLQGDTTSLPSGVAGVHHCAAFGWLAAWAHISQRQSVEAYLYSSIAALVSACVRLIPLGHTEGQKILAELRPSISEIAPKLLDKNITDMGSFAPLHEWASHHHESLYSRLFQS